MPPRRLLPLLLLAAALLPLYPAHAWNRTGHKVTATIAYEALAPHQRRHVAALLRHHPDYPAWRAAYDGAPVGTEFDRYVVMQASVWPDQIRGEGGPYDHPEWHYADYPLVPPAFPFRDRPAPGNDAVHGIRQSLAVLRDASASAEARAAHLSWLLHLVGDLHQPLHASALTNATYPTGDRGGNDFYVRRDGEAVRLHSLWDGLLGRADDPASVARQAAALEAAHPRARLPELRAAPSALAWSRESRAAAVEHVYRRGRLAGAAEADAAPALPEGYVDDATALAERRVALAGYRLAGLLRAVA